MHTTIGRSLMCVALVAAATVSAPGQSKLLKSYSLSAGGGTILPNIPGNTISHIQVQGTDIWIGTNKGLARSSDGAATWESFAALPQFANPGIFAIALHGNDVWASTGYSQTLDQQDIPTGSGYAYSLDNGTTWFSASQPLDALNDDQVTYGVNTVHFLTVTVLQQNVTYDIALTDSLVWIASWSSGLRRSADHGQHWQRTVLPDKSRNSISPSDTLGFYNVDPRNDNNFLAFSVFVDENSTVWAGTAGGINKSTDGGISWTKFSTTNQQSPILGNWVIAIKAQQLGTTTRIWATNWPTDSVEQYAVAYTDNGGGIWTTALAGIKAYDFAFKDSTVYVGTDDGIYRSGDGGFSWEHSGTIVDRSSRHRIGANTILAVGVLGDTVYGGTEEGLVRTIDNATHPFGQQWDILSYYYPVPSKTSAYISPNPFSPEPGLGGPAKIHYTTGGVAASVTIEVFDFGMNRVRTVVKDAQRSGVRDQYEEWDGKNDAGRVVANGVYFYRVIINGADPIWGKAMVLQ